jgi:transglutaminase-like putative cysteine protease
MIALCRAVNIPARFVTGIDYGAAAELGLSTSAEQLYVR